MVKIDFKPMTQTSASVKGNRSSGGSKEEDFISMIQKHASKEKAPAAKTDNQEKTPASETDNRDKAPVSEKDTQDKVSEKDDGKVQDAETNLSDTEENISAQAIAQLQVSMQLVVPVNLEEVLTEQNPDGEAAGLEVVEPVAEEALPGAETEGIPLDPAVLTLQEDLSAAFKKAADKGDAKPAVQTEGGLAEGEIMADAGDGERPVEALSYGRQSEYSQKEDSGSQSSELDGSTNAYSEMFRTQNTESQWSRSGLEKAAYTPVVRTTPETFGPDIGKTLAARIPEKNGTLTIELEPASLGKLTIRVIYEAGKAAVSIMADNPKTLELLNQNAAEIARIMEEKTGQETVIYTPEAQQQMGEKTDEQGKGRQNQEQEDSRKKEQSDAFAQQLRLGLV